MSLVTRKKNLFIFIFLMIVLFLNVALGQNIQNSSVKKETISKWKIIGPGGGGGVFLPTVSPLDENLVLSHCDMTGGYISENGGKQWRMFNLWTMPVDFKFHPANADIIYTATKGYGHSQDRGAGLSMLYRSMNRGKSWEILYPDVSKASKSLDLLQSQDFLPSDVIAGAVDGSINKIAIDPAEPRKMYLGLSSLNTSGEGSLQGRKKEDSVVIIASSDGGKKWKEIARFPGRAVKEIFPSTRSPSRFELLIFTDSLSFRINERTGSITAIPLPVGRITAVKGSGETIYIQSPIITTSDSIRGGIYVSKNRGKEWKQVINGILINGTEIPSIDRGFGICESFPATAFVSVERKQPYAEGKSERIFGIYKTNDFGENWKPVLLSSTPRGYITDNFSGGWMEKSFDPGWGRSPLGLGVSPTNPNICYASDEGRAYKTVTGGKTWEQIYSTSLADGSATTNGLDVTTSYGVHFDPFDKNHYFICYTDIGLFHTFNGGKSWVHSITNIPKEWENTCYQVVFDPAIKGKLWSVWANAHDLPREKMFSHDGFARNTGGVALSTDAGRSWEKSNQGIPANAICTGILLGINSPSGNRTLYTSVFDKGVYKSTDDGKNWVQKNIGLGENLFAWQLRMSNSGRLYLLCSRGRQADGNEISGSVFYSDDKAETWQQLILPKGYTGPHDLLLSPLNDNDLYISCWPQKVDGGDRFGGLLKSSDKGMTWKQVFDERIRVNSAAADSLNKGRIFINTFQNAAFVSENNAITWKRLGGYRFKWGQRIIPDLHHPGNIFLTTFGGSVFYGPAHGVSNSRDDIINMPLKWW